MVVKLILDDTTFPTRDPCFDQGLCNVTQSMLSFLNITTKENYIQAYCLNPAPDSCPFDFCPNPDIAGISVRVSTYVVNICLGILILYSHEEILPSFYSQVLTVYSFMLTAMISIQQRQLTRLHATFAQFTIASPLSLYLLIYALRSTIARQKNRNHRLAGVVGEGKILNRVLVLAMFPLWLTLTIFISLKSQHYRFSQEGCDWRSTAGGLGFFYFSAIPGLNSNAPWWEIFAALSPILLLIAFWIIGIFLQRKTIWKIGRSRTVPLARMWRKVNDHYPFIRFYTIILLPFAIWITALEIGTRPSDQRFQVTFGQILPIFVAIPPLLSVLQLIPMIPEWFSELTWVRFLTGRKGQHKPGFYHTDTISTYSSGENTLIYGDNMSGRERVWSASSSRTTFTVPPPLGPGMVPEDEKNPGRPMTVRSSSGGMGSPPPQPPPLVSQGQGGYHKLYNTE